MPEQIYCQKLQIKAEALAKAPYPGELGQKILTQISKPAWQSWLKHQTMLINEYRLDPLEPKDRAFLEKEMQTFLFSQHQETKPPGYTPP